MTNQHNNLRAFTIVELLVVIGLMALLGATLLPAFARAKAANQRVNCSNNLKQIGVAFQTWAAVHNDAFPMNISAVDGGYADYIGQRILTISQASSRGVFGVSLVMSNELSTPRVLFCPVEEGGRTRATTFAGVIPADATNAVPFVNDLNTSYFVAVDASETTPQVILSGDHNLGSSASLVPASGFVTAPDRVNPSYTVSLGNSFVTNGGVAWLDTMHTQKGNVVLADGSVQQLNRARLQQALAARPTVAGYSGRYFPVPTGCFGSGMNRVQFP